MGLYNFKKRFVPFILNGRKTHTIREPRKHPDKLGNTLHLYTGLRQKGARLLMRVPCVKIEEIEIRVVGMEKRIPQPKASIWIDGVELNESEIESFARRDGFDDFREMMQFWHDAKREFPWHGHIIHWRGPE